MVALACADGAEVRGRVADAHTGAIPGALVRLIPAGERFAKFRALTNNKGEFDIKDVPNGAYTLRLGQNNFQERSLSLSDLRPGEVRDIGEVAMPRAGCEAPGVICDFFAGSKEEHPVVKLGYLTLSPGDSSSLDASGMDVTVTRDQGSWRISPVNGARLSSAEAAIPLDGLGPGAGFHVQTGRNRDAHVIVVDEIRADSTSVRLWFVTRR